MCPSTSVLTHVDYKTATEKEMTQSQKHQNLCQDGFLLQSVTLGGGNGPDEHAEDSLGNNVSDRVADLLCCCGSGTADAHHLDNVDTRVGQPRHSGQKAGLADQSACGLRLGLSCRTQANEELEEDEAEWQHGKSPPQPAALWVVLDLSRVAQGNHQCRGNSQRPGQRASLIRRESHHQDQLNQQERHGQEPVDVPVGIVEWLSAERDLEVAGGIGV